MTHAGFIGLAVGVSVAILGWMTIASLWQRRQAIKDAQQWISEE